MQAVYYIVATVAVLPGGHTHYITAYCSYAVIVCSLEERQLAEAAQSGYVGPADVNSQPAAASSDSVPVPVDTALLGEVDKKSADKSSPTKLPSSPHRGRTASRPSSSVARLDFCSSHFSTFLTY